MSLRCLAGNTRYGSLLAIMLLMAVAFWFFYLRLMQPPVGVEVIESLHFMPEASSSITPAGERRSLPDDWLRSSPGVLSGWYQTTLPHSNDPGDIQGLYLPAIQMNAEVFVDGELIGRVRHFSATRDGGDPYAREIHRPAYFLLPPEAGELHATRELRIHVTAIQPGAGFLGPLFVGPDRVLHTAWENRFFARITNVELISAGMLSIAILMTVLWWLRRQESVYGWFALLIYTWVVHNIFLLGLETPFSSNIEDWISLMTLGWFVVFMVITTHRYLGLSMTGFERGLLGVTVFGTLILALSNATGWFPVATHRLWSTFILAIGAYCLVRLARAYRYREDLKNPFVPASGLSILLLGTHDWLLVMDLLPRGDGLLLHFSAPVTLITFASLLLERFSGVLREAESLNLQLEMRVAEKHRELKANFEKLREMENRQVLTEERERFMKEMHDGVGGHLIAMLSMMRSGESDPDKITRAIETTLSDLRIMIDSLEPDEHDIPALLGAMRMRLEPQLEHSRIRLEWQVSPIPPLPDFGPRKALQVMRILQEAISNVINHADARLMRIRACVVADDLGQQNAVLDIIDDGKGLVAENSRGRGLNNMRQRAASIGASLDIGPANPGTRVRLRLPYPPATQVRE